MIEKDIAQFQQIVTQLLTAEKEEPVVPPIKAEEVFNQLDLKLETEPLDDDQFYQSLKEIIFNTPRTATNQFFNQLFGGRRSKAVLGDLVAVMLNNSMYTYKVAGPIVGVEKAIIKEICSMIGYGDHSDGTFASGGSMSNLMAMVMARDAAYESMTDTGVERKMTLYTSEESHYSIPKNASLIGIGKNQVRYIQADDFGIMKVEALEKQIEEDIQNGFLPFMVNATAGTTVLGAFDKVGPISDICKKHALWLHVDGAYCGAVVFSKKYKYLLKGLEEADSFSVNAHKMLGTPLTCSILVAKDEKYLHDSFSYDADYLYQTDNDDFNLGKISLQCGRRNDALKFWTLWKSIGTNGLEKLIDHQFFLADIARNYIQSNEDYTLYSFDNSISVCFNYKGISPQKLCTLLYKEAKLMVGFGSFQGVDFVRLITINSDNSEKEILNFFTILEDFVAEHQEELLDSALIES